MKAVGRRWGSACSNAHRNSEAIGICQGNFQPHNWNMFRILFDCRLPCFPKLLLQATTKCCLSHTSGSKDENQRCTGWLLDRLPKSSMGFFEVRVSHHFFLKI